MYYKPSEIWNIEYATNVIKIFDWFIKWAKDKESEEALKTRKLAQEAINYWNQTIKDQVESLIMKNDLMI